MRFGYVFLLLLCLPLHAHAKSWKIIPEKSSVEFSALYGKDPITGAFPDFSAEIMFTPEKPEKSKIRFQFNLAKVSSSDKDAQSYLPLPDWFSADLYPVATFESTKVSKLSEKEYRVLGNLTIRDKTVPVELPFTLDIYQGDAADRDKQFARVVGKTTIKRLDFGVGQGEWSKTDVIQNDVGITVKLEAVTQ